MARTDAQYVQSLAWPVLIRTISKTCGSTDPAVKMAMKTSTIAFSNFGLRAITPNVAPPDITSGLKDLVDLCVRALAWL